MVQCQPEPGSNNGYTPMLVVAAEIKKGAGRVTLAPK
jgi:hypothetical protein